MKRRPPGYFESAQSSLGLLCPHEAHCKVTGGSFSVVARVDEAAAVGLLK